MIRKRLTKADLVLILLIAVILGLVWFFNHSSHKKPGAYLIVEYEGEEIDRIPLNKNQQMELSLHEDEYYNQFEISEQKVRMINANCPDGLCVHQASISHDGESIVCLPHRLVLRMISDEAGDYDAVAR